MFGKNLHSQHCGLSQLWHDQGHDQEFFEFQRGNDDASTEFSEIILVRMANTFDHAMDAKIFEAARNLPDSKVRQMLSHVFISQSGDDVFSANNDLTEVLVIWGEEIDAFVGSAVNFFGFRNLTKDLLSC